MIWKMSELFVRTLREDPADAEVASHKWMVRAGYTRRAAPGIYEWLPLGLRVLRKVENIIREEMDAIGGQEVLFPALLPKEPYEATGRWIEYGPNLFRLKDRRDNDYLLAPTHEEMFTLMVKDMYSSYKDLPLCLYQIQTKYRDEARPRAGLLRGREFIMKDAYSFDINDEGLDRSYQLQRDAYIRIFDRLGLEYVIVSAMSGAMGGSRSEEFLHPSAAGEDTFARTDGGYAANVEAVTTIPPQPLDYSDAPEPQVIDSPGAATIETLVDFANANVPRDDRPWQASDTLKNVVVVLTHPDGERELLAIGLPGDREVDETRLAAALAPAEVEMADDEAFKDYPELVRGYIGPQDTLGPNTKGKSRVRYLIDPRVVEGTRWVTGANEFERHIFGLVCGRDFTADGIIEVAEVREGDPAPDGSGPLHLARGIEIGHIFQLGRKYAEALNLQVLDENGKQVTVTMGSYGIGVSRAVAAIAESNHDDRGLKWPLQVAPAHVHIVATGKTDDVFEAAANLANSLNELGVDVIYDDRPKVSPGVKFADAEILGIPYIAVVGKSLADGQIEIRNRHTGDVELVPVADAASILGKTVTEVLASTR